MERGYKLQRARERQTEREREDEHCVSSTVGVSFPKSARSPRVSLIARSSGMPAKQSYAKKKTAVERAGAHSRRRRRRRAAEDGGNTAAGKRGPASTASSLGYVTCRSLLFAKRSSGEVSRSGGSARENVGATRLLAFRAA